MARARSHPSEERIYRSVGRVLPSNARPAAIRAATQADPGYGAPGTPDWREIDWSKHVHDVTIAGRRVRYADYGSGPEEPVVFIHGWTSNWQCWLENIPAMAAPGRRVIALDLPGSGLSEMPVEKISISGYARTVEALCEHLGLATIVVIGNSMGGFISAELAIAHPSRVERLVLVSAAGISSASMRNGPAIAFGRALQIGVGQRWKHSTKHPVLLRPRLRHVAVSTVFRHPTRISTDLLYEMMGGMGRDGFYDQLIANISYDYTERLGEIAAPTLVVWGREDGLVPLADAYEYDRIIPDSRLLILEDTGHVPMAERPQAFNEAVLSFVEETGSADQHGSREAAAQSA